MCCEACPAVFHAACLGLPAPPTGDFYCPLCTCSVCGGGGSGERMSALLDCSTHQLALRPPLPALLSKLLCQETRLHGAAAGRAPLLVVPMPRCCPRVCLQRV